MYIVKYIPINLPLILGFLIYRVYWILHEYYRKLPSTGHSVYSTVYKFTVQYPIKKILKENTRQY